MNVTEVQKHLRGTSYPATKDELVEKARESGAPEDMISALEESEQDEFGGPNAVMQVLADEGVLGRED